MRTRVAHRFLTLSGLAVVTLLGACGRKASGGTAALAVSEIQLGRSVNADLSIQDQTTTFRPTDVIYASVATKGAGSGTINARWTYQDGQQVSADSRTIAPNGPAHTEFHISKPSGWPAGKYHVEITLNGASVGTKDFEVKS